MAWKILSTAFAMPGKKNGSARLESRGFRNARTSSAQVNARRRRSRAMHSEPHSSGHGISLLGGATSRAKIHCGCTDYFMRRRPADKNLVSSRAAHTASDPSYVTEHTFNGRPLVVCATQD